jgi:hypothetical protein
VPGRAFGHTDAENRVLDVVRVDAGSFDGVLDDVAAQRRAVRHVERAAERLADRRPRAADDNCFVCH